MRTTLTLDPDVAQRLKSRMAEQKATLKQVVNEALRRGLAAEQPRPGERSGSSPIRSGFGRESMSAG